MKEYNIKIAPINFISFESIEIDREINQHSKAVVVGCISDDCSETYVRTMINEPWVTIETVDELGKSEILFKGIVTEFSIDHEPHQKKLRLVIHSGSYLMDVEKHFRTFQNSAISYSDILDILEENYTNADHISAQLASNPIGDFLMQYQETDWQFIERIASRLHYQLSPADTRGGARYYFGLKEGNNIQFPENVKYTARKLVGEYMIKNRSQEFDLLENDCMEFIVSSREIYHIWDKSVVMGTSMFVYKIESRYAHGELLHNYYLRSSHGIYTLRIYNQLLSGCSFESTVKAVKQDLVQVNVRGDENSKQEITKWFKYSTVYSSPDGTGWYCMPEIGDTVRLHIPNKQEYDGYVISSGHLDVSGSDRKNPDCKSIMNKYRKEILFTPNSLILTNNRGISIEIIDSEGINIISSKSVHIQANDSVTISSENASMMVAGTSSVLIRQSGAGIYLDDDISFSGGEFRIQ
jgi:hypothetical protein